MTGLKISEEKKLVERLRNLDFSKRKALFELLADKGINPASLPIVPMLEQTLSVPSYAQQRLWFLW